MSNDIHWWFPSVLNLFKVVPQLTELSQADIGDRWLYILFFYILQELNTELVWTLKGHSILELIFEVKYYQGI